MTGDRGAVNAIFKNTSCNVNLPAIYLLATVYPKNPCLPWELTFCLTKLCIETQPKSVLLFLTDMWNNVLIDNLIGQISYLLNNISTFVILNKYFEALLGNAIYTQKVCFVYKLLLLINLKEEVTLNCFWERLHEDVLLLSVFLHEEYISETVWYPHSIWKQETVHFSVWKGLF